VEIYDPVTNSWQNGPDLPVAMCGIGVVKYRATIYVLGKPYDDGGGQVVPGVYQLMSNMTYIDF
jgi:hypothetical protein